MPYKNIEDSRNYARSYCPRWRKRNPEYHKNNNKEYRQSKPWAKTLMNINARCGNRNHHYYKKEIKNFLTVSDLEVLWFRDRAYLMKCPSIDRKDNGKGYTLENCRYLELSKNNKERLDKMPNNLISQNGRAAQSRKTGVLHPAGSNQLDHFFGERG